VRVHRRRTKEENKQASSRGGGGKIRSGSWLLGSGRRERGYLRFEKEGVNKRRKQKDKARIRVSSGGKKATSFLPAEKKKGGSKTRKGGVGRRGGEETQDRRPQKESGSP